MNKEYIDGLNTLELIEELERLKKEQEKVIWEIDQTNINNRKNMNLTSEEQAILKSLGSEEEFLILMSENTLDNDKNKAKCDVHEMYINKLTEIIKKELKLCYD